MSSPPPRERLDPRALPLWRIGEALQSLFVVALAAAASIALIVATDLFLIVCLIPIPLTMLLGILDVLFVPSIRWRHWRYDVGELEVDLQRGLWTITRTRIPMARIQHVDTRRGPLERHFGLATVILYTAAGANQIPALALPVADEVRDRIAALANTRDDV
jgi:membrane protein YdbS with pleckstrin-like domain